MSKYRLVLVDDHQMFLDGLELILSSDPAFEIVSRYNTAEDLLKNFSTDNPDVLITDLNMPEVSGITLTREIKAQFPDSKILVLSMHNDRETVSEILDAEAEGYVLKNSDKSELVKAIKTVAEGGTFYSNEIVSIILSRFVQKERKMEVLEIITDREKEVLELIAQELSNDEIAEKLFISKRTVETHRKNLMAKTKAGSIVGLLKFAVRNELILFSDIGDIINPFVG